MRDDDGAGRASAAMTLARGDAARADRAEACRLLYVAITRAKDYLIFASHQGRLYTNRDRETWFDVLLGGLDTSLEAGERTVSLPSGHKLLASVRPPSREDAGHGDRRVGPRDVLVDGRVVWTKLQERGQRAVGRIVQDVVERMGPVVLDGLTAPVQITATALATYRRCPAAYWWSEVLGVEEVRPAQEADPDPAGKGRAGAARAKTAKPAGAGAAGPLSPRQWGRLSHRALELAASPDGAGIAAAVDGALREAAVGPDAARETLRERLAAVVREFWASGPGKRVAAARRAYRELPFVLALGESEIRGVIDLLFENADGRWEVLDYKASAPAPEEARRAAAQYDLQLGLYALAAGKWLGQPVQQWTVCFLDADRPVERAVTSGSLIAVETAAREALAGMAARRFAHKRITEACQDCRFKPLCG
jgi:RecB family exonuclease